MSSNEIATDMGLTVEVETASEGDSLASGSGHSRTRQPNEPVRFSDLVLLGRQGCRVIMTQRGAKRVCGQVQVLTHVPPGWKFPRGGGSSHRFRKATGHPS